MIKNKLIVIVVITFIGFLCYYYESISVSTTSSNSNTSYNYPPNLNKEVLTSPSIPQEKPSLSSLTSITGIPTSNSIETTLIPYLNYLSLQPILNFKDSFLLESNFNKCLNNFKQSNQDQLKSQFKYWKDLEEIELMKKRNEIINYVLNVFGFKTLDSKVDTITSTGTNLSEEEWNRLFGNGKRGIVYTAGNKDTLKRLLTSLKILRLKGCQLPVEIWGFKQELDLIDSNLKNLIEGEGNVTFHTLTRSEVELGAWKQFQVKGEAIARSSFSEVLYLDSDNIVLRDPTFLFDSPLYKEHGIVLWPDITKDSASNPIWRMTQKKCSNSEWQIESGQILISKLSRSGLNLIALIMSEKMNQDHQFWYRLSGGDKDTFRYAFYFLSLPYTPAPHWVSLIGSKISPPFQTHTFCGHSMLQFGLSPIEWNEINLLDEGYIKPNHSPPLFLHANLLKHSGYNNQKGNTFQSIKSAIPSLISSSISSTLLQQDIRTKVFNYNGGMCTDLRDSISSSSTSTTLNTAEEGVVQEGEDEIDWNNGGRVDIINFNDSWGAMLRGFEELYYQNGGEAGAW